MDIHTHVLPADIPNDRPTKRARTLTTSEGMEVLGPPHSAPPDGHYVQYLAGHGRMTTPPGQADSISSSLPATPSNAVPTNIRPSRDGPTLYRKENRSSKTLSCNECRRLKLKCDRVFPCQSCCKRGCAEICPDGALTSGKGSRFILANTEQLHDKIQQLSDRVRQLEEALESLQAQLSSHPHPLLAPGLLKLKSTFDIGNKVSPSGTNLSLPTPKGRNKEDYPAESSSSKRASSDPNDDPIASASPPASRASSACPEVPPDILQLSSAFPVPWTINLKIRKRIRDSLPSYEDAKALCQSARQNALWQFNLDSSNTFLDNLLAHVYSTPVEDLSPRRLALLLMNLAVGSVVSECEPIGSHMGEAFHHLARASLCEISLVDAPDFDVVHTLFYMIWYLLTFSNNNNAVTLAWNTMGLTAKLAQGLGLHRDASRAKVLPEEDERKRAVFWELVNIDTRLSLSLGRPPSLYLMHIDAKPPVYGGCSILDGSAYHDWKARFLTQCLDPILQITIQVEPPSYHQIIQADVLVRDFQTPEPLSGGGRPAQSLVMQHAVAFTGLEIALLQLHRRSFLQALNSTEEFNLEHEYAPSVLATYLSASSLISSTEELFNAAPDLSARFLHFWFNVFSAGVALSLIAIRAPSSRLSPYALQSLKRASQLFRRVAKLLPFCAKALPLLDRLLAKSQNAYDQRVDLIRLRSDDSSTAHNTRISSYFTDSHARLRLSAENIATQSRLLPIPHSSTCSGWATTKEEKGCLECLPSVYGFNVLGLGIGDRCSSNFSTDGPDDFAKLHPHPFAPCASRIAENDAFNLDCGAFTLDLADTSYMAWF